MKVVFLPQDASFIYAYLADQQIYLILHDSWAAHRST